MMEPRDNHLFAHPSVRRLAIAGAAAALVYAVIVWLFANDYESFIESASAPARVPPQVAGALGAVSTASPPSLSQSPITTAPPAPFIYAFNRDGTLHEARTMDESSSPYFWLSAGGSMVIDEGLGRTMQGSAPFLSRWRLSYMRWNPLDTEFGYRPQNVFRLVTRQRFADARIEAAVRIERDNLADSPNRNQSNGLFVMTRYQDKDTLYYLGLRVDGTAVIKKKYQGLYYTMAQERILPGRYSTHASANLLPHGEWLTLRADTEVDAKGGVTVKLYLRREDEKNFKLLLTAYDDGKKYAGTPPISNDGHAGIRTDFMDVSFKSLRIDPL